MFWVLAILSMTVGNLIALRQTNVVRLLAYSSIAQAGYMLAPLAVAGEPGAQNLSISATVIYLLIYAAMNLGAFAIVITVARKTRSAELDSFNGLFEYAPGLTVVMSVFLFALAGLPPLAGWFAKFQVFYATANAGTSAGYVLAVFVGVNSVIALFYYARIAQAMWMQPVPDGDRTPIRVPPSLAGALALCTLFTVAVGLYPQLVGRIGDMAQFAHG
jgi:NADH-quinone oxidoreductase subunit N